MVVKDHEDPLVAADPFSLRYEKLDLLPNPGLVAIRATSSRIVFRPRICAMKAMRSGVSDQ